MLQVQALETSYGVSQVLFGLSFAVSLVLSPVLVGWWGLSGLFWTIACLGVICLGVARWAVPVVPRTHARTMQAAKPREVLTHRDLLRLNFGVFVLHLIQVSLFVVVPALLPAVLTGFTLAFGRAIGEYGSVVFISGNLPMKTEIVPLLIISKLEQYDSAGATALGASMLVISFAMLASINALQWWAGRHGRVA